MSSEREQHVWRVPLALCGLKNYRNDESWDEEEECDSESGVLLDWHEFQEEHEELFDWHAGKFCPSLSEGYYLDYVIMDRSLSHLFDEYQYAPDSVFHKILPDLDLDVVHYCSYRWYDGTDAPEMY